MAVKTIGQDGLDDLGIDEFNRLYWKGERVVTETMIDLPAWVDFAVGAAAVATVVIVLIQVLKYFGIEPARRKSSTGDG
jgi:hypothetical protein